MRGFRGELEDEVVKERCLFLVANDRVEVVLVGSSRVQQGQQEHTSPPRHLAQTLDEERHVQNPCAITPGG